MNIVSKLLLTILFGILCCSTTVPEQYGAYELGINVIDKPIQVIKNPQSEPGGL